LAMLGYFSILLRSVLVGRQYRNHDLLDEPDYAAPVDVPEEQLPTIAFVWSNFGPYHVDRLRRCRDVLSGRCRVLGIEVASSTVDYPWGRHDDQTLTTVKLFDGSYESISRRRRWLRLVQAVLRTRTRIVFLCHYEQIDVFLAAVVLRLAGCTTVLMNDSKWDDKPRLLWRELAKLPFILPYNFALVAGDRHRAYLETFGFRTNRIFQGYDTIDIDRIRSLGAADLSVTFADRSFVVIARFVAKKKPPRRSRSLPAVPADSGSSARLASFWFRTVGNGSAPPYCQAGN